MIARLQAGVHLYRLVVVAVLLSCMRTIMALCAAVDFVTNLSHLAKDGALAQGAVQRWAVELGRPWLGGVRLGAGHEGGVGGK